MRLGGVVLIGLLMAGGVGAQVPEFEAGEALQPLFAEGAAAGFRFGLNGAPPGALGVLPSAPGQAGAHWLVGYDNAGRAQSWQRFRVRAPQTATADESRAIVLLLDSDAPSARLIFEGPVVEALPRAEGGRRVLGAAARILVEAEDDSGVVAARLRVDGRAIAATDRWSEGLVEGAVQLAVDVSDALGNQALRAQTDVWLDLTPPALTWERLDAGAGVPADVFDGRRARLRVQASDALSGLTRMVVGGRELDPVRAAGEGIELRVDAHGLDYLLVDGVGNRVEAALPLRVDREGPVLQVFVDDQVADAGDLQITRAQRLRLQAKDAPAGVASACVEASVWYRDCRELPMDLVGLSPGRYRLDYRASDTLGNRSTRRFHVEVRR